MDELFSMELELIRVASSSVSEEDAVTVFRLSRLQEAAENSAARRVREVVKRSSGREPVEA